MIGQLTNRTPRKTMSMLFGILITFVSLSGSVWGAPTVGATPSDTPTPSPAPDPTRGTIRYDLTGPGVAEYVTYQTNSGQQHATNVSLPWSVQFTGWMQTAAKVGSTYLVSAHGAGPGSISCKISVNGDVVSQNTATGDPARVVCEHH